MIWFQFGFVVWLQRFNIDEGALDIKETLGLINALRGKSGAMVTII